ncbi:MAG: hypothetical protein DRI24_16775 [Deltaproteobacteria bacterium]|nr:MAG: hypothetical protein DRI24_16775 [Deltaproteobacteria bacterium]
MFSILDVSCGFGTQSLGLAKLGYQVTVSDISAKAIDRAREEAEMRQTLIVGRHRKIRICCNLIYASYLKI